MSGLILCGKRTTEPFRIEGADINIYSIEELSYYLYNNIFMVGKEFFDDRLLDYISEQLGMKSLAGKLKYLTDHRGTFPELMMMLIKSASYYNESELEELEDMLRLIGTKSVTERLKVRADIYMKSGKMGDAMKIYTEILTMPRDRGITDSFYGKVYHNIGVIHAGRMEYAEAVQYFRKAYELCPDEKIIKEIVKIDLLWDNQQELINDTMKYEVTDEMLDEAGDEISQKREEIMSSEKYAEICNVLVYDGKHNLDDYYENIQNLIDRWKNDYREEMV